jgi:hypothetical protein
MAKDLTNSAIERKNILNNNFAIQEVYTTIGFKGILFENKFRFTKQQIANYFVVDVRTIDRLLENHKEELELSGYELFTDSKLRRFKDAVNQFIIDPNSDVHDMDVVNIQQDSDIELDSLNKSPRLGVFTYKAFLNIGMLLTDSEKAQQLRSILLDIVIDVLNKKLGGNTKYINQREEEFVPSAIREYNYRQEFTNALDLYISENKFKYSQLTDKIYKSIFKENAKEYRQILKLNSKASVRNTMYSEVLDLIASYENGFADFLKRKFQDTSHKIPLSEAHKLFSDFESMMAAFIDPLREKARSLMASRDMAFREALHEKLKEYIDEVSAEDYDKFLGERSKSLEERLEENKEVFKRLKNR